MALSNDLISQFVKATRDKEKPNTESTAYGKIVVHDGKEYVQLDGSELLTPISSTIIVKEGDRVIVTIKDHTAIVTGDFTNPSANNKDVTEIGNKISEFEIVIADKVTTKQLEAEMARIEQLRAKDLEATNAKIETLEAKTAKIDKIEADQVEISGKVEAHEADFTTLRADIADFKDVTTESVKAVEGKFNTLEADYTSFEETTTNKLTAYEANIKDLEADMLTAEKADLKYANIDFSNIKEAAIEKLFTDSGIIKDLIMSNGKVTGELVGVTIKGDLIEGNTVKADKLVILGEDGLYYKLNVDTLGETTASADPKYQNGLDGSVIIAESITAEKIAVDDLVAFGATIGGFNINDHAIYSGAKAGIDSNNEGVFIGDDGQINIGDTNQYLKYFKDSDGNYKLEILADSLKFGANKTTIEEYIESKTENISTIKEAEGSDLYIDDGQQLIEFRVDGKSEQETRSGKNLYNATVKQQGGSTNRLNASNFSVLPNTTYTLSTTSSDFEVNNYYKDVDQNNISESKWVSLPYTFTTPENCYYIAQTIRRSDNSDITPSDFINVQLEIGSTATDYEPYGASPSPDYPSEIKSVGFTNLFDKDNATYTSYDGNWCELDNYISIKNNTSYVLQGIIVPENWTTKIYVYDKDKNQIETITRSNAYNNIFRFIISNENAKYIRFTLRSNIIDLSTVMLEEGVIAHSYIPFGKYGIEVKTVGKNLFDGLLELGSFNSSGVSSTNENCVRTVNFTEVKPNATYTISNDLNYQTVVMFYDENKNFIQQVTTNSLTISSNVKYIKWRSSAGNVENNLNVKYMLEKGSVATEYEPYRCHSTLLALNEPLRSLPNGIKDIAYIKNSKLYVDRYVCSVVLDGSEEWIHYSSSAYPFRTIINNAKTFTTSEDVAPNVFCNNYFPFAWGTLEANRPNYGITSTVSNTIAFRNIYITTLDDFKTWLSNNNIQVDYELAESITEEIGYVDLSMTENSVNDYSVNDPMSPNLYCKYYKDGVLIDDTIAEEFKNINNNLINNYYTKTEVDTQFKVTTDSITASVSEIKKQQENTDSSVDALDKDIVELSKTVSAKMTSEEVTIAIQNELANGVSHVKTSTGFTFNEEGLTVSKDGRDMKTTINEDGMIIKSVNAILEEEDKLIANSDGVFAYDLRAKTYLIIGANSRFEDYEKNGKKQTGCFWIGDTEV